MPPGVPLSEVSPSSGLEDTVGVAFDLFYFVGCAGIPWLKISAWVPPAMSFQRFLWKESSWTSPGLPPVPISVGFELWFVSN